MSKSDLEIACQELGILPQTVKKWSRTFDNTRYSSGEKPCIVNIPKIGKRKGYLAYVSRKKANVYVWVKDQIIQLPKKTHAIIEIDVYVEDPLIKLLKYLDNQRINYIHSCCQLHGDRSLKFVINNKVYSINLD
jgi:hypothetical protein